jgi:hypothetical protein
MDPEYDWKTDLSWVIRIDVSESQAAHDRVPGVKSDD